MNNTLQYQEALEIYKTMDENLDRKDEDILALYNGLIEKAIRYAHIRAQWKTLSREQKMEKDDSRSSAHNAFISSVNIIARTEGSIGSQWKERLTDDRKRIGDFACYIALFYGLDAR